MAKIMIVDDSAIDRAMLARILQREGYETIVASDGEGALASMESTTPDLVVLDIGMPGLDGLQLLEMLHDHPRWSTMPVIMMTGVSDTLAVRQAEQLGAKGYLVKATFSINQMLDIIRQFAPPTAATPLK